MRDAQKLSDKQANSQCTRRFIRIKSSLFRRSRRDQSTAFSKKIKIILAAALKKEN
jgi:hypothetical protein